MKSQHPPSGLIHTETLLEVLEASEKAMDALYRHTKGLYAIARSQAATAKASAADDDEWMRMPVSPRRCPISGWSRSTIESNAKKHPKRLRTKLVDGGRYYAGRDVREWLSNPPGYHARANESPHSGG